MTHLLLSPQAEAGTRGGLTWSELGELTSLCTPPNGVDIPSLGHSGCSARLSSRVHLALGDIDGVRTLLGAYVTIIHNIGHDAAIIAAELTPCPALTVRPLHSQGALAGVGPP